ncbi:MAG TPA: hypothetical protein VHR84_02605 [Terriglobales bacterium]|jgi:uncharacterized membrane protein|nr:hypothetical protein [Terriglobales bacterium]
MNMPASCPDCGSELPAGATQCPRCYPQPVTHDTRERLVAVACYLTPLPAIAFLLLKPFRDSAFIRFHALQSTIVGGTALVLILLGALFANLGWTVAWLMFGVLFFVALFFLWLVLSIKAAQGMQFELPFVGQQAAKRATRGIF